MNSSLRILPTLGQLGRALPSLYFFRSLCAQPTGSCDNSIVRLGRLAEAKAAAQQAVAANPNFSVERFSVAAGLSREDT